MEIRILRKADGTYIKEVTLDAFTILRKPATPEEVAQAKEAKDEMSEEIGTLPSPKPAPPTDTSKSGKKTPVFSPAG